MRKTSEVQGHSLSKSLIPHSTRDQKTPPRLLHDSSDSKENHNIILLRKSKYLAGRDRREFLPSFPQRQIVAFLLMSSGAFKELVLYMSIQNPTALIKNRFNHRAQTCLLFLN